MTRNWLVSITAVVFLAHSVAALPAQESSRRTAKSRASGEAQPIGPLAGPASGVDIHALTPTPDNPPLYQPPQMLGAAPQPLGAAPGAMAAPPFAAGAPLAPPPAAVPHEMPDPADGQLHSVLKRGGPAGLEPGPSSFHAAQPPFNPTQPSLNATQPPLNASQPPLNPPPLPSLPRLPESSGGSSRRSASALQPATPGFTGLGGDAAQSGRSVQDVAVSGKSPALRVDVVGPQGITVGKPAPYVINLVNEGDSTAEEVLVRVSLPGWVTVRGAQPTTGDAQVQGDVQGAGRLMWNIPRVAARSQEQLRLALVTTEGDGFDLGVEWKCKPSLTKAAIFVKQPKLQLSLAGPADMTFAEEKVFTLSVTNPGSGDAERVVISIASGSAPPQQIDVGAIPAGYKKDLPLQVVASQPGVMDLRVTATGEGGLSAETLGKITVRKAEVSVAIEGPPLKFAGTEAVYQVTVANQGSAAADNVNVSLALPTGAKYLGGIEGSAPAANGSLKWRIASLAPGSERNYELRLQLLTPGLNRMVVQTQANASGTSDGHVETEVQAISDLKLLVNDPSGPMPTGEQAVYEVQVMNRGSQAAQRVKIVMQFSSGIEPVSYEGCDARIVPGQVVCQPLVQLGAGEQVTLRVRAKAQQAGTHQFRVEVTTADGDSRLVSEGTTRFFSESGRGGPAATTAKRPALVPGQATPATLQR